MSRNRLKVGIAHPYLGRGGSESRVMWAIEALKADYDVSVITGGGFDLETLNSFYGTAVAATDLKLRKGLGVSLLVKTGVGDALRGALHQAYCRKIAKEFDILISAYNLIDFGVPGIQCIADFCWDEEMRKRLHPTPSGVRAIFHRDSLFRRAYLKLSLVLSRPSGRDLFAGADMILANSKWSAEVIRSKHGAEVDVLYPPVLEGFSGVPWGRRENGFVCLGRIAPEKRIERIVEILRRVRGLGHDVHLHVIGDAGASAYGQSVQELCRDMDWVTLDGPRFGKEKAKLLASHKYALHGCQGEAFGIAVAEMVKAGCVSFAPAEGGQAEVLAEPSVLYDDVDSGVEKIDHVLRDSVVQARLCEHFRMQAECFSPERFMAGLRRVVDQFATTLGR